VASTFSFFNTATLIPSKKKICARQRACQVDTISPLKEKKSALKVRPVSDSDARRKEKDLRRRAKFIESLAIVIFRHENFLKIRSRHSEKNPSARRRLVVGA
jgi:hypothetical protein